MNIIEAMRERRSVRSYNGEAVAAPIAKELLEFAGKVYNPFGGQFTVRIKRFDLKNGFKPSTYGMIRGAEDFFMVGAADDEASSLSTGFCFEQVVLKAWQLGLGTCWIAATFKGTDFETAEPWPAGERLKIISPVGTTAKKGLIEKISRVVARSDHRKPFSELFFEGGSDKSLSEDSRFGEALAMLRLAPSSTNSQPWRALVDGDKVHFYYVPKSALSILDCGIGLCHFYETERFYDRSGDFYKEENASATNHNWKYLISYAAG
ncbi:MAG: hypothetical protein HDS68_00665 [Bacteroidales bacterium]|nr:hypothetical protein [Bacteroidales bacterium]